MNGCTLYYPLEGQDDPDDTQEDSMTDGTYVIMFGLRAFHSFSSNKYIFIIMIN